MAVQYFPVRAAQPDQAIPVTGLNDDNTKSRQYTAGWNFSGNADYIVKQYSHLRVKKGLKLIGYRFIDEMGGNGVVWAVPEDSDEAPLEQCSCTYMGNFPPGVDIPSPKPGNAIDPMEAIEGDQSPLSYLQAAMAFHGFMDYGAYWHGAEWGYHTILPSLVAVNEQGANEIVWDMIEDEPEAWEPCFYYTEEGLPTVVFYTWCTIHPQTLNRFTHTFAKDNYTDKAVRTVIASGPGGIIF